MAVCFLKLCTKINICLLITGTNSKNSLCYEYPLSRNKACFLPCLTHSTLLRALAGLHAACRHLICKPVQGVPVLLHKIYPAVICDRKYTGSVHMIYQVIYHFSAIRKHKIVVIYVKYMCLVGKLLFYSFIFITFHSRTSSLQSDMLLLLDGIDIIT